MFPLAKIPCFLQKFRVIPHQHSKTFIFSFISAIFNTLLFMKKPVYGFADQGLKDPDSTMIRLVGFKLFIYTVEGGIVLSTCILGNQRC